MTQEAEGVLGIGIVKVAFGGGLYFIRRVACRVARYSLTYYQLSGLLARRPISDKELSLILIRTPQKTSKSYSVFYACGC